MLFPLYVKNVKNYCIENKSEECQKFLRIIHDIKYKNSKKYNFWCRDFRSEIITSAKIILNFQNFDMEEINETLRQTINVITNYSDLLYL